jgi:MoxR-like ATPase
LERGVNVGVLNKQLFFAFTFWIGVFFEVAPVEAGLLSGPQSCSTLFTIERGLEKSEKNKVEINDTKKPNLDKAIALFQRLPTKFRREMAFDLAVYLAKYSPDPAALERAATLYKTEGNGAPKTLSLAMEFIKKGEYQSNKKKDYLEFSIRMYPELNEILRLFEIPGFELAHATFEQKLETIKTQLMHLDAVQAQIVIRSTIHELIEKKDVHVDPYSFALLMRVAMDLSSDKGSRYLAEGLKKVFNSQSVFPNLTTEENQIRTIVRKTIDSSSYIGLVRVKSAIKKAFHIDFKSIWAGVGVAGGVFVGFGNLFNLVLRDDFSTAKINAMNGDLNYPYNTYYDRPDLPDYTGYTMYDHWQWQIATVGIALSAVTLKSLYHFFYDLKDPHPGNYLREETNFELKTLKDSLKQNTVVLMNILGVSQNLTSSQNSGLVTALEVPTPELSIEKNNSDMDSAQSDVGTESPIDKSQDHTGKSTRQITPKEVRASFKTGDKLNPLVLTSDQESANKAYFNYFEEVRLHLLERDTLLDQVQLGLLLNEPVNIQILGEPGTAKTQVAVKVLGQVLDAGGSPSFYRFQMGKNTTIGELIGPVKQSGLKEDRIVRASERALPGFRFGFLDEYYDAPIDTRRDLLTLQAEGLISLGGEVYKSNGMMTLYASNKYPDQVFYEAGNDDPRAEMDRMLFTHIMGPTFEYDDNMIALEGSERAPMNLQLSFAQIDQLKNLVQNVSIPRYYLAKTKFVINRLRQVELKREHQSKLEWLQRERNGEINLTPPYYMTRVLSPRSEKRAYQLLKAFALMDWLAAKAKGLEVPKEPQINESHFLKLVEFFVFNGPSNEHIDRILREYPEGSIPYQQFFQLKQKRNDFFELVSVTNRDVNHENPMKQLSSFLRELNISTSVIEIMTVPRLNEKQKLNNTNAPTVMALIEWHQQLGQIISNQDKIKEISANDVASLKAYYLGTLLINKILGK